MSGHSKFNPTFEPIKVYPARTAMHKKLLADIATAINHGCPANTVLEKVQKFIDNQQERRRHKAAVDYLGGIFAKICQRCADSPEDCEEYVEALRAMVNKQNYIELNIKLPAAELPGDFID